uniref:Uncharacterized protein n=1 Tax=Oryza punctata TaxID=4537 RepID=A0A0E0MKK4_ORYPU
MVSLYSECSLASSHPTNRATIPPRVGPFKYHPAGVDCNLFDWYDPPASGFMRELLNDLRDVMLSLRRNKAELECVVEELRTKEEEQCVEITEARHELAALRLVASKDEAKIIGLKPDKSRLEK